MQTITALLRAGAMHLRKLTATDLGFARKVRKLVASTNTFGLADGLKVILYSKIRLAPWNLFTVHVPGVQHPIYSRTRTSDPWVLQQIFVEHEYAIIDDEQDITFVLDCGASTGYSSIYFLNRFPHCRVLAVEADRDSAAVLSTNLRPYGDRAQLVVAGVWSGRAKLAMVPQAEAWENRVRAVRPGERGDLEGVDIPMLLEIAGADKVDLLKMDIEGSEGEVFSGDVHSWLPRVRNIVMEIHDKRSEEIVWRALAKYDCRIQTSGELWIFRNIRTKLRQHAVDQAPHA